MDITVEAELKAEFFDIFSADIGVSVTTGYDWTHATDSTKSEQTTITVEAEAPPGKYLGYLLMNWICSNILIGLVLKIEQAVGQCDGSQARTEMFRTSHYNKTGSIVSQVTEKLIW